MRRPNPPHSTGNSARRPVAGEELTTKAQRHECKSDSEHFVSLCLRGRSPHLNGGRGGGWPASSGSRWDRLRGATGPPDWRRRGSRTCCPCRAAASRPALAGEDVGQQPIGRFAGQPEIGSRTSRRPAATPVPRPHQSHDRQQPRVEIGNQERRHGQAGPNALQPGPIVTPIVAERLVVLAPQRRVGRNGQQEIAAGTGRGQKFREHGVVVARRVPERRSSRNSRAWAGQFAQIVRRTAGDETHLAGIAAGPVQSLRPKCRCRRTDIDRPVRRCCRRCRSRRRRSWPAAMAAALRPPAGRESAAARQTTSAAVRCRRGVGIVRSCMGARD